MNQVKVMSRRVNLSLPDRIHEKLERWAYAEGRATANLCNFILEKAVREAEERGEIPLPQNPIDQNSENRST